MVLLLCLENNLSNEKFVYKNAINTCQPTAFLIIFSKDLRRSASYERGSVSIIIPNNINLFCIISCQLGIITMKKFYLSIFTIFTITQTTASGLDRNSPVDEASTRNGTNTPSEAGSYAGSFGMASTIIGKHQIYTFDENAGDATLEEEYGKLMRAYTELLKLTTATDSRLTQFVGVVDKILPGGVERSSADEDSLITLRTAFRQLMDMYKTLGNSYNGTTGKVTVLESTIAELTAGQEALKATLATMAPRPTEHMTTDMSPERKAAVAAAVVEGSDVVADLRAKLEKAEAEKARLAAENAALKAAAAKAPDKGTAKTGVKEPLLNVSDRAASGYTQLDDDNRKRASQKEQGCPCSVM